MDPRLRTRFEIEAIHDLLPEVGYYQLLCVADTASQADIDAAYRNESRRLHPDRLGGGATPELKVKANDVFRALSEAGRILRDPDSRNGYDAERRVATAPNPEEARAAETAANKDVNKAWSTPKGEKHWKMALKCWNDEDYSGTVMQINFALQYEPKNELFKEWLTKAKQAMENKKRGSGSGSSYKIRIV